MDWKRSHESYLPREWHEVVLAKRGELNVFHNYHLVVIFVKHGVVQESTQILSVPFCEEKYSLRKAIWGIKQALPVWILAHTFQDRLYCARQQIGRASCRER